MVMTGTGGQEQGAALVIGGETISAKDDYLKTITNLFYKINGAADSRTKPEELQWILSFYTDMLINSVLNPNDRDKLVQAKEDIYIVECIKRATKPVKSLEELNVILPSKDKDQAMIVACTRIIGEFRNYIDRYFGFETKLSVML